MRVEFEDAISSLEARITQRLDDLEGSDEFDSPDKINDRSEQSMSQASYNPKTI